jgi:hypothetical protein
MDADAINNVSPADRDMWIRTVIGEAGDDPSAPAVASVVANRMRQTGQSATQTVLAHGQFEPWSTRSRELMSYAPDSPAYQNAAGVVDSVISGKTPDPTNGATMFYAPVAQKALGRAPPSWDDGTGVQIGAHKFFGGQPVAQNDPGEALLKAYTKSSAPSTSTPIPVVPVKTQTVPGDAVQSDPGESLLKAYTKSATQVATSAPVAAQPSGNPPLGPADYLGKGQLPPGYVQTAGQNVNVPNDTVDRTAPIGQQLGVAGRNMADYVGGQVTGVPTAISQQFQEGGALVQQGNAEGPTLPSFPSSDPKTWQAGGVLKYITGRAGQAFSPLTGMVQQTVQDPVTQATGSPDIGERAGFVANSLAGPLAGRVTARAAAPVANALAATAARVPVPALLRGSTANAQSSIAQALVDSGKTIPEVQSALAANPRLSLMDIDPNLQIRAMGIATQPGPGRAVLDAVTKDRMASAPAAVQGAYDSALGPVPDVPKMLGDIRARYEANAPTTTTTNAAIDSQFGPVTNPKAYLDKLITDRSTAAQPLYEKAFQGGSVAPLESQFGQAFDEASQTSSQAAKDLATARQSQLLARAKVSNAGDNVYVSNSALAESRQADASVSNAEQAMQVAEQNKQSILGRLQQAQADGSANAPGAVWTPRIQQFLDDPIVQPAIAKGIRIQRLEALANGEKFDPTEYAVTGSDASGNPVVSSVPNMRTLNVVKKGLDSMVGDAQDPITGRLSEEGRAIDGVRRAFLTHIDSINSDYKAARQAWAGPTQAREAFARGLSVFSNQGGLGGVENTPEGIASWMNTASQGEQEAAKLGARTAYGQQLAKASDPTTKAANLANLDVNKQKFAALFGQDKAEQLAASLNSKYADPVGDAFTRGVNVLSNRGGESGLENRPEFLANWMKSASPEEVNAMKLGARTAIDQKIQSTRFAARTGAGIPDAGFNSDKLETILGKDEAGKLSDMLKAEQKIADTNQKLFQGSQTYPREAGQKSVAVRDVSPISLHGFGLPLFAEGAAYLSGHGAEGALGLGALGSAALIRRGLQAVGKRSDTARNTQMAQMLSATGPAAQNALARIGKATAPRATYTPNSLLAPPTARTRIGALLSGASSLLNKPVNALAAPNQ